MFLMATEIGIILTEVDSQYKGDNYMNYFDILFAKTKGVSSNTCYNEIEAMLKTTVGHSSKDLLEITEETRTISGVTFTVDKTNGTIIADSNGQASTGQIIFVVARKSDWNAKNAYFSGCANGGTNDSFYLYAYDHTAAARPKKWDGTTNSSNSYSLTDSQEVQIPEGHDVSFRIMIRSGVTVNNLVFKPMLRDGSISDDTFEPYVQPTDEKKQDKPVVLWEAALNSTGVSEVPISSLADNVANYSYLKVVVTNELGSTITDQDAVMANVEYDPAYIGRDVGQSTGILGFHVVDEYLVFDRLFIWVVSDGINISVTGLRDHNETSDPPDAVSGVFIRKIIGIPK